MKKRRFKRIISMLMAVMMIAGLVPGAAFADVQAKEQESPHVVSYQKAGGVLNLTEEGDLDWIHTVSGKTNRKNGVDPIIELDGEAYSSFADSPVQYSWSDGNPDTSVTGNKSGGCYSEFDLKVAPADYERKLVFVSGAWQTAGKMTVADYEGENIITEFSFSAGGSADVRIYTVILEKGHGVSIHNEVTDKEHNDGNISLSAVTLGRVAEPTSGSAAVEVTSAPGYMDLTEEGTYDWIHLAGREGEDVRKNIETPIIQVNQRRQDDPIDTMGDSPVIYEWSDGTPQERANSVTTGGVYTYRPGDHGSVNVPIEEEAGFEILIDEADHQRTLSFVSGAWNAKIKYSVFFGDSTEEAASYVLDTGGGAETRLFEITLEPGQKVRVISQYEEKRHEHGNTSLGAVVLKAGGRGDYPEICQKLIDDAKRMDTDNANEFALRQLEVLIDLAEQILAAEEANSFDIYKAYLKLYHAYQLVFHQTNGLYKYQTNGGLVASFGWEGDLNAPISYIDGSYQLRSYYNTMITFGVTNVEEKIKWYNAEGYLPSFISEYSKNGMDYSIENFGDLVQVNGNDYVVAYSRMIVKNNTDVEKKLPVVSEELIPLNEDAMSTFTIAPGEEIVRDYAVPADRFGRDYDWPTAEEIAAEGGFDKHYNHMKDYWNARLSAITQIVQLPDESLINAYKAGFIYTLIVRDDILQEDGTVLKQLHVGENGYDIMFDHDTIGIVAALLTIGDFTYAKDYLATLPAQLQYDDAKWKYSWPYALYLQKTGDIDFIKESFSEIKKNTHMVETDRIDGGKGIMKQTFAIDSIGYWTIDNWSALAGLTTYIYLCEQIGNEEELAWAQDQYESLLEAVNNQLTATMDKYNLNYIPISMYESNEMGPRSDPRDANWASMFLFGRWGWDGYLFGAEQEGMMIDKIDDTYAHGFKRREGITNNPYNFGGYPHGYYSSAYNAGYGSTALRGEAYRDAGIKGYQFMIQEAMSGPFSWWEGVDWQRESSPWDINHASGGGGSCQHMWGQSTATKVLMDSLIAEKSDGTVIIGRGIPEEWISDGNPIQIENYPIDQGNRMGYTLETKGNTVTISFSGANPAGEKSIELIAFKNNIESAEGFEVDQAAGIVKVPSDVKTVVVELKDDVVNPGPEDKADKTELKKVMDEAKAIDQDKYTEKSVENLNKAYKEAELIYNNDELTAADQQLVDDAAANLKKAIKDLEPLKGGGGKPGEPGKPSDPDPSGGSKDGNKTSKGKGANTGDSMNMFLWTGIIVCAAGAGFAGFYYKKKKQNIAE